jgi:hypothetical protein
MTMKTALIAGALALGVAGAASAAVSTTCKPVVHRHKAVHRKVLAYTSPPVASRWEHAPVEERAAPTAVRYGGPVYYDAAPGYVYAGGYGYAPPYPAYGYGYGYGYPFYFQGPGYGYGFRGGYYGRGGGYGHGFRGGFRR